ncbi:amino acid adenylation domain-containing protein [Actinokineospora terrae]|uniref:Amino acid adenylation domain-containing protein n=1 Tax=Actinokineospora terrae TaxID=155974 RepID=A0A1H9MFD4_9PSEU|nr:amino acid adenylation domain-containing protein [Actinokineospora terrae]SER22394.1 amino acid adenylation domain-containing protein [Actinokineospora terrae]
MTESAGVTESPGAAEPLSTAQPNTVVTQADLAQPSGAVEPGSVGRAGGVGFPELSVGELVARQAGRVPGAVAVRFRDRAVTYRELDRAANGVAWRLREAGVRQGAVVGVAMGRTPEFVVVLLGVLKAGGAYLPIDAGWPAARLATMVGLASVRVVITDAATEVVLPEHVTHLRFHASSRDDGPEVAVDPGGAAVVNFTSGSTGEPKGVLITHRGITSLLFPGDFLDLSADTVLLAHMSPSFDGMTVELWGPLLHGGTCVLFDGAFPSAARLRAAIRDNKVNTLTLTAALFNVVVDSAPDLLDPLSALVIAGEPQSPRHVRAAHARVPGLPIINAYGPTETTVIATTFPIAELAPEATSVPIGRALPHREVAILGPDLRRVARGEVGEICVSGPGVALGYVGRPDLTADRFVTVEGRRVYRTGDLGRLTASGDIEFLGRADRQVKLNGQRIELEEVEHALVAHPDVWQAVALVHGEGVTRALKAVLVTAGGVPDDLRGAVGAVLPAYMIPGDVRAVDALPLNQNGKVDRAALAALFD